jgi:UDP-glucose 4-epimerase
MSARPWLVTGAAGFLGSHVVDHLMAQKERVVAVDNLAWGKKEFLAASAAKPGFTLAVLDIRDTAALSALMEREKPKAVVHLAALHFIPACVADPPLAVSLNVLGTQSVLTAASRAGVERTWIASTGDVYGPKLTPHREDETPAPFNIYGVTKLLAEQLAQHESRQRPEATFVVGRLLNLVGPRETNPHILPEICRQLRAKPRGPLHLGNVSPRRDLVPIRGAARSVVESCAKAPRGLTTLNIATGRAQSIAEVIERIGGLLGTPLAVETDPARVRATEREHLQADVGALRRLTGWAPEGDLDDCLRELLGSEGLL